MPNLFRHLTDIHAMQVCNISNANLPRTCLRMGCRNKFGMTPWFFIGDFNSLHYGMTLAFGLLNIFINNLYAPGTPAGSCLKNASEV